MRLKFGSHRHRMSLAHRKFCHVNSKLGPCKVGPRASDDAVLFSAED